jgi:crotonobetaine/carnitine-CoA ligase
VLVDLLTTCVISRLVQRQAEAMPDKTVLVFENGPHPAEQLSFADVDIKGNQLAALLRAGGCTQGDRLGIMLRNHPEFVHGYVAAARLGVDSVPIDPRSRGDKLAYFLAFAECKALLVADYTLADPDVEDVIRRSGVQVLMLSTAEGRRQGLDLSSRYRVVNEALDGPERPDMGQAVDDLARTWLVAYTSGTTGDPKAILFSYERHALYQRLPDWFSYRADDVPYTGLSLTHGNAILTALMPALWQRVDHSVFSRWFTKSNLWRICSEFGATTWSNLGGIATAVYSQPPSPYDREHRVRLVVSAGMPAELWRPFEDRYAVSVLEWYGTMEGGFAYNPVGAGPVGSFGKPPADVLTMIVADEHGREVPPGTPGELLVRPVAGPACMSYYKNPEATERKVADGWLHTGDVVQTDDEGWLYYLHRREDGGLRKLGEFVLEGYIRRVLAEDPQVEDVHVYGIPAASGAPGETDIVAAVVPAEGTALDVAGLFELCRQRLERSQVPDVIQLVEELPKTPSAKVQVRFLVQALEERPESVHRAPPVSVPASPRAG